MRRCKDSGWESKLADVLEHLDEVVSYLEVTDPWDAEHLIRTKYLSPWPTEAEASA